MTWSGEGVGGGEETVYMMLYVTLHACHDRNKC